ncbi:MAG: YicC family protein [Candidatus Cloacimonetes bacterium]|nr:YicC family protein [Candidatus Cloacimonadota bacterium]
MKSMTGFGKAGYSDDNYEINIEIKSVNSRFLDLKIKLPYEISFLEPVFSKTISQRIKRGKVDVYVNFLSKKPPVLELNEETVKTYWDLYSRAKEVLKTDADLPFANVLSEKDVIAIRKDDLESGDFIELVSSVLEKALAEHQKMAQNEGRSMLEFLTASLKIMKKSIDKLQKAFPKYKKEIHNKLKTNVETILKDKLEGDDYKRFLQETALYIEKADVNEEIVRLQHHLEKFKNKLNTDSESGKSLNFILQEMLREINTIGSKFTATSAFDDILTIKEEIEKCRELVQNVE